MALLAGNSLGEVADYFQQSFGQYFSSEPDVKIYRGSAYSSWRV